VNHDFTKNLQPFVNSLKLTLEYDYDEGLDPLPEPMQLDGAATATRTFAKASILYTMALIYQNRKQYALALQYCHDADKLLNADGKHCSRAREQAFLRLLIHTSCVAARSIQERSTFRLSIYKDLSTLCRLLHGSQSYCLACCLNAYAVMNYRASSFQDAFGALRESIYILESLDDDQRCLDSLATSLFNLGRVLSRLGEWDDALTAFQRALRICRSMANGSYSASVDHTLLPWNNISWAWVLQ
jgi:tetratricopeptide (TPR) repeat protein